MTVTSRGASAVPALSISTSGGGSPDALHADEDEHGGDDAEDDDDDDGRSGDGLLLHGRRVAAPRPMSRDRRAIVGACPATTSPRRPDLARRSHRGTAALRLDRGLRGPRPALTRQAPVAVDRDRCGRHPPRSGKSSARAPPAPGQRPWPNSRRQAGHEQDGRHGQHDREYQQHRCAEAPEPVVEIREESADACAWSRPCAASMESMQGRLGTGSYARP